MQATTKPATPLKRSDLEREIIHCATSSRYFIETYCKIYDPVTGDWVPFVLWPAQVTALEQMQNNRLVVILKPRQVGITWLVLCYILWLVLFRPIATALLFSRRDDEAVYLISNERLKGVYNRLPEWLQARKIELSNAHQMNLSNGSTMRAFPTNAGDSYTASVVMADEADLIPNLNNFMRSVKPTIDAGGQLILLSRVDKSKPASAFKETYRAARKGTNGWFPIFLPWHMRPDRTRAWYEKTKAEIIARTGSTDDLYEQYPETEEQALAPRTLDKRIPFDWLQQCRDYDATEINRMYIPDDVEKPPLVPKILVYKLPAPNRTYGVGADPAEGNPTSDDSACTILCRETGEEVASFAGKFEPTIFASYVNEAGLFYNKADVLVERNNHGHVVIAWLKEHGECNILNGYDDKPGWLTNSLAKSTMYSDVADAFRDKMTIIRNPTSYEQLASIEGSTLKAPENEMDDLAVSYALAYQALLLGGPVAKPFSLKVKW